MQKLQMSELKNINAGAITLGKGLIIVGAFTFIIGVIDGFIRPLKCK